MGIKAHRRLTVGPAKSPVLYTAPVDRGEGTSTLFATEIDSAAVLLQLLFRHHEAADSGRDESAERHQNDQGP